MYPFYQIIWVFPIGWPYHFIQYFIKLYFLLSSKKPSYFEVCLSSTDVTSFPDLVAISSYWLKDKAEFYETKRLTFLHDLCKTTV